MQLTGKPADGVYTTHRGGDYGEGQAWIYIADGTNYDSWSADSGQELHVVTVDGELTMYWNDLTFTHAYGGDAMTGSGHLDCVTWP